MIEKTKRSSVTAACVAALVMVGLLTALPARAQIQDAPVDRGSDLLIPASLARVDLRDGVAGGVLDAPINEVSTATAAVALPRRRFLGLGRGAKIGAIAGGVILATYGAVWCNRECEGSPRAPALYGFVVGGATGALLGGIAGGIFDRVFRLW